MWSREGWEQEEQKTKGGCAASILEGASSPGSGKRKLLPVVLGHLCSVSLQAAQRKLRQASTNVKHWNVQMNRLMHPIEPGGRRPSPWHAAQCCCWFSCPVLFFGTLGEDRQLLFFFLNLFPDKRTNMSGGGFAGYPPLMCRRDSSLKLKQKVEDKGSDPMRESSKENVSNGGSSSPLPSSDADTMATEPSNQ